MKISLDSNAWETIFDPRIDIYEPLRNAFKEERIFGFLCETAFRIEAIKKTDRAKYFSQPKMGLGFSIAPQVDGRVSISMSMGPDDKQHPGLPEPQDQKLQFAREHGISIMRGIAWFGLPSPFDQSNPGLFVPETKEERARRDQCRHDLSRELINRRVGRYAFEAMDGWNVDNSNVLESKKFYRACAEWADGELVIAHVCHQNDVLCTNDHAGGTGASVFDAKHREWLHEAFGVTFLTVAELLAVAC